MLHTDLRSATSTVGTSSPGVPPPAHKRASCIFPPHSLRWDSIRLLVLACMACVPRLDPLWPTGMTELARQEAHLRESLPVDIDLQQARGVLRSQGIESWEHVEKNDNVIFTR